MIQARVTRSDKRCGAVYRGAISMMMNGQTGRQQLGTGERERRRDGHVRVADRTCSSQAGGQVGSLVHVNITIDSIEAEREREGDRGGWRNLAMNLRQDGEGVRG